MSRVGLVVAAATTALALAGCSAMPDWVSPSDWFSSKSADPPPQALRFESSPPGADVRTTQGLSCTTPCALTVPSVSQPISISKPGFVPQTIQVAAGEAAEHSFWESATAPALVPNPVQVMLQAVPPPHRVIHRPKRKSVSRARTAAKTPAPQGGSDNVFPDPPSGGPAASPFPPPPATR
ncbi:MAG: hypothetical protein WBF58_11625 [Xanthobacteraceae bacterium]